MESRPTGRDSIIASPPKGSIAGNMTGVVSPEGTGNRSSPLAGGSSLAVAEQDVVRTAHRARPLLDRRRAPPSRQTRARQREPGLTTP
jgi:hypothetical protein